MRTPGYPSLRGVFSSVLVFLVATFPLGALPLEQILDQGVRHSRTMARLLAGKKKSLKGTVLKELEYHPQISVGYDDKKDFQLSLNQKLARGAAFSASTSGPADTGHTLKLTFTPTKIDRGDLDLARLDDQVAILDFIQDREKFKLTLVQAYFRIIKIQEEIRVEESSVERFDRLLEYARTKYELGLTNKIDILNAEVRKAAALRNVLAYKTNLAAAMDSLKSDLGMALEEDLTVLEKVEYRPLALAENRESWVREDLEIARKRLKIFSIRRDQAFKARRPDLDFSLSNRKNAGQDSTFSGELAFSYKLGEQTEWVTWQMADLDFTLYMLNLSDVETTVALEKREIMRRIEQLESSIALAKKELETAEESFEFSNLSFQKGLISNIALLDSQDKLTQARKDYMLLLLDHRLIQYQFHSVFGKDL